MKLDVNIDSGNGLVPDGTKPLPEPMLTYNSWDSVAFTSEKFTASTQAIAVYGKFENYTSRIIAVSHSELRDVERYSDMRVVHYDSWGTSDYRSVSEWVIQFNGLSGDSEVHIVHNHNLYILKSLSSLT